LKKAVPEIWFVAAFAGAESISKPPVINATANASR
jgi:hypothetical protein